MEATSGSANAVSVSQSGRNSWLLAQAVFAIVGGAVLGHFVPELAVKMKPLSGLFGELIKLVIPPIIFLPIVTCMASAGNAARGIAGAKSREKFQHPDRFI